MIKREIFKIEGDKIIRLRRNCPKCGDGVFLAEHKNRLSCGKCGYTEFKGKREKIQPETPTEDQKKEEIPIEAQERIEKPVESIAIEPNKDGIEKSTEDPSIEKKTE